MPRHDAIAGSQADALDVARQLLDGVDRRDPLDLDGDPGVLGVAAHEVDGADVGRPLATHEAKALAAELRRGGERLLQVALDAVLLERGGLAHVVRDVADDLGDLDLQAILARAGALAHDDRVGGSPVVSMTVGAVIQLLGL